jgi:peptidoglycan/xylan/chitin deacetylase (PgdA/CDA1 family)
MTEKPKRPVCSVSLDLDNQWSYMKTHGDEGWRDYPSYLDWAVPRILDFLDKRNLKITFFIVGQDAVFSQNMAALRAIGDAGHEIGNHSFRHEPWLHLYSKDELTEELDSAERAIAEATGQTPVGFRGPGFSLSATTLTVLSERGYEYDATVFPNLLNPLARAYFFATSSLTKEEKEQRKALFGTWRDALRPVSPFSWKIDASGSSLLELPVTTMPIFKTPMHLSYILYASRYSRTLAMAYFRFSLAMCRMCRVGPSLLLHPLDFIGCDDVSRLEFFPGMDMNAEAKIDIVGNVLDALQKHYEPVTVAEHLRAVEPIHRQLELSIVG